MCVYLVGVDFSKDVVEHGVVGVAGVVGEGVGELGAVDVAAAVLVEEEEGRAEVVVVGEALQVDGHRHELAVVQVPIAIHIRLPMQNQELAIAAIAILKKGKEAYGLHEKLHLGLGELGADLGEAVLELLERDPAVVVGVHEREHVLDHLHLLYRQVFRDHLRASLGGQTQKRARRRRRRHQEQSTHATYPHGLLLEAVHEGELLEAGADDVAEGDVGGAGGVVEPGVVEHLLRRGAAARVHVEHLADEGLGGAGDARPWLPVEVGGAAEDGARHALLRLGPKRRDAAQEDVEDDAGGPDVHLRAVVSPEHLRRHVVRAPHDLPEPLPCFLSLAKSVFFFSFFSVYLSANFLIKI